MHTTILDLQNLLTAHSDPHIIALTEKKNTVTSNQFGDKRFETTNLFRTHPSTTSTPNAALEASY